MSLSGPKFRPEVKPIAASWTNNFGTGSSSIGSATPRGGNSRVIPNLGGSGYKGQPAPVPSPVKPVVRPKSVGGYPKATAGRALASPRSARNKQLHGYSQEKTRAPSPASISPRGIQPKRSSSRGSQSKQVLSARGFLLTVRSMAGEEIARLQGASEEWTRIEVENALSKVAPLPRNQAYKLAFDGHALAGKANLKSLGIKASTAELVAWVVEIDSTSLDAAVESLDSLSKVEISALAAYTKPPHSVLMTMEAVMVTLGTWSLKDPERLWPAARKLLRSRQFLTTLRNFTERNDPQQTVDRLGSYILNPQFHPESVKSVSSTAGILCIWCHAIYQFASSHLGQSNFWM
eukprot:gnl/MRDRNA2_/MRDRNA2_168354_c0_seq1.p1 gnl/MRDRNA2_/MRDRNA2_168354_c0~~gnl/MRDRNA2_/MRDRNA2_168354_c0_seq1.p1  ORF type:complete len:348 (+),score=38.75 gnl/MRDRNA2_/MRDRNA2_168354_c0_seq1:90-1133(+)